MFNELALIACTDSFFPLIIQLPLTSFCLFLARQPPVGQGLLMHEVFRSQNDAAQSVGLLWTSDQLVAETST